MTREFDAPWKEALDHFLRAFLRYFLPALHAVIDWTEMPENLETELQKITERARLVAGRPTACTA